MVAIEQQGETSDPIADFDKYVIDTTERLAKLQEFLGMALSILEDLQLVNGILLQRGGHDLVISDRAEMMPLENPEDGPRVRKLGNFAPKCTIYTGIEESDDDELAGRRLIPITPGQLRGIADGSYELDEDLAYRKHVPKPAFRRMLVLFPEFSEEFIISISDPEDRRLYDLFLPEIFVAYQLMSRLVDKNDEHVLRNGEVETWYLCH